MIVFKTGIKKNFPGVVIVATISAKPLADRLKRAPICFVGFAERLTVPKCCTGVLLLKYCSGPFMTKAAF